MEAEQRFNAIVTEWFNVQSTLRTELLSITTSRLLLNNILDKTAKKVAVRRSATG
jgi:hypothetical protein